MKFIEWIIDILNFLTKLLINLIKNYKMKIFFQKNYLKTIVYLLTILSVINTIYEDDEV